jgi:hypothetical protein
MTWNCATYKDSSTTLSRGAFTSEAFDLAVGIHFVVLQDRHLDLLAFMLDLLRGLESRSSVYRHHNERFTISDVVCLLLALLGTTTETKDQMKGRFLLNVIVAQSTTILELLASKD